MGRRDPKREAGRDYGPRGSLVPYAWEKIIDQRSMEAFCDLMAIRKLETGDYACTIEHGL